DDDVDAAELSGGGRDQSLDGVDVAEMRGYANGFATTQRRQLCHRGCARLWFPAGDGYVGVAVHQGLGESQADAAGSAGDDCGAILEIEEPVQGIVGQGFASQS